MIKIIPGIYQIQLPLAVTSPEYVNAYLVQGDNGYLLVDTGWDTKETFDSLERQLAEIGIGFEDISQIVITHIHADHYSLTGRLKQLSQAKLAMHSVEKDLIELRYTNVDRLLQQTTHWLHINGVADNELPEFQKASRRLVKFAVPVLPDVTLYDNEIISTGSFQFKVLWTPGHSPGHISLYEPTQKILIAGDHILPTVTPTIGLYPQPNSNPLGDYLNSLNQLRQLDVNLILPGHENPFTGLQRRIEELILHHEQRNSEILENIKAKPKTAYRIATGMTWMLDISVSGVDWERLASLDKRLAFTETLAHLESMIFSGKVDKFSKDSIIYYQHT